MLKKLRRVFIVLVLLLGAFAIFVAMQPADYRVARTANIAAPPATVFAQVNDFHNWPAWSPWIKLDPAATNAYEGAPAGTGAGFTWSGNDKVGQGRMTIIESRPDDLIRIKLDFVKPFPSTSTAQFDFKPAGDQTTVTWSMTGKKNFVSKAFCLFMSMDKMVGGDFERGLAQMKTVAEAPSTK